MVEIGSKTVYTVCRERHFRAQFAIEDRLLVVKGDQEVNSKWPCMVFAIERYKPKACMLQYLRMHVRQGYVT